MALKALKKVLSWRMTRADPSGMMMWFDPTREEPALWSFLSPDGEVEPDREVETELDEGERVEPLEGGDTKTSAEELSAIQEPPGWFLDSLWEGNRYGT